MDRLDDFRKILTKHWGYASFRPLQEDIIRSVADGKDTLVLMPTGGGKSITFQVPALASEGICLVITPLIALMKDQVDRLKQMNIKAIAIHSGLTKHEIDISLDNSINGNFKFLYLSPERLKTEVFKARVQKMNVSLVAIDEAHCISQWGYDFRPSYLQIAELRELLPEKTPFLALTATATPAVVEDIMEKLNFKEKNVLSTDFARKNLIWVVRNYDDKKSYLLRTLTKTGGQGIIYVRNRKLSKDIATMLLENGISAEFYHAGLPRELRERKQNLWMAGTARIMVATNAFGMGIDKDAVRFVIHWDISESLEAFFQESGRAGRDRKKAWAVQLYSKADISNARRRIETNFPPIERIKDIYELLSNFLEIPIGSGQSVAYDFSLTEFVSKYKISISEAYNSLKFLQKDGYIELTDEIDNPSRVYFTMERDDLYKFQVANSDLDGFIKLLLRNYSGLFNGYVAINEDILARKSGLKTEQVLSLLINLNTHNVISFVASKKTALIVFNEERLERKSLSISHQHYSKQKEIYIERIEAMIAWIENSSKCREKMLLDYFGQKSQRCGTCDVCLSRNELDLSKYEFDMILDDLKAILSKDSLNLKELISIIKHPEDKVIKVLRWLLDHDKVKKNKEEILSWKNV